MIRAMDSKVDPSIGPSSSVLLISVHVYRLIFPCFHTGEFNEITERHDLLTLKVRWMSRANPLLVVIVSQVARHSQWY
jgi:hypothetical protein